MFHVRKIDSLDLPELQPYRVMRWQQAHRDQGIFVAEGEKVVRRLFKSDFGVASLLIPEKWLAEYEPLLNTRRERLALSARLATASRCSNFSDRLHAC